MEAKLKKKEVKNSTVAEKKALKDKMLDTAKLQVNIEDTQTPKVVK